MKFVCTKCGRTEPVTTRNAHCSCGGLWKLDFTPEKFELSGIDTHEWSQFRYRRYMALDGESWRGVTLGEGNGHNWWCVVFPPLCLTAAETEAAFEQLDEPTRSVIAEDEGSVCFKFRILELWGELAHFLGLD